MTGGDRVSSLGGGNLSGPPRDLFLRGELSEGRGRSQAFPCLFSSSESGRRCQGSVS